MFMCLVDSLPSNRLQSYKLEYIKCIHILRGGFQLVKYVFSNFALILITLDGVCFFLFFFLYHKLNYGGK